MSRKTIILLFLFIVIPITIYFVMPTDTSRIKKLIKRGADAIERKDVKEVMSCVSLTYRDDYGMSYLYLKKGFERLFNAYDSLEVEYENVAVVVDDKRAVAELDVWVIASRVSNTAYIAGDAGNGLTIKFLLQKEKLRWQVVKTEGLAEYYF
jgi:hypothetical protein